jgi:3D (Asp-Asp-Asp) domain-containing protein
VIAPARLLTVLLVVLSTAACATVVSRPMPAPAPAPSVSPDVAPAAHGTRNVNVTFYGGPDNDPPGSTDIAYPNGRHGSAGGVGSYDDPVTLATDPRELPPGTVVYVPRFEKYFVMEDDCEDCIAEWGAHRRPHIDLWMAATGSTLPACEQTLTPDAPVPVEINPPAGRPVDTRPLYDPATGSCW